MRTTLTLDDDVAVQVERLRKDHGLTLKDAINTALRRGLTELGRPVLKSTFSTPTFHTGQPRVSLDSVAEALALAEGEDFR